MTCSVCSTELISDATGMAREIATGAPHICGGNSTNVFFVSTTQWNEYATPNEWKMRAKYFREDQRLKEMK